MLSNLTLLSIFNPVQKLMMEVSSEEGGILAFWYDNWLFLGGMVFSLLVAVLVIKRNGWNVASLLPNGVMVTAVVASLPLTMLRLGFYSALLTKEALSYISIIGVVVALVAGLLYLWSYRTSGSKEASASGNTEPVISAQEMASGTEVRSARR